MAGTNEAERIADLWRPPGLESGSPGGLFSEQSQELWKDLERQSRMNFHSMCYRKQPEGATRS